MANLYALALDRIMHNFHAKLRYALFIGLASICLLSACTVRSSIANDLPPKQASFAIKPDYSTGIGKIMAQGIREHPRQSAFRLVTLGSDAFFARVALIRMAERSLDFQYYIVEDDLTGSMLLEEILRAADRGVRVRLLVDSLAVSKVSDEVSLMYNHPNISIRAFNPINLKDDNFLTTVTTTLLDFERVNSRMHNKALISDNLAAIIGGRNLGDQYFDASADFTFSDMDVVAAGPIVQQISYSFDHYWNSDHATRLSHVKEITVEQEKLQRIRTQLSERWQKAVDSEAGQKAEQMMKQWKAYDKEAFPFVWAYADLAVDDPDKVAEEDVDRTEGSIEIPALELILPSAEASEAAQEMREERKAEVEIEDGKENSKPFTRLDKLVENADTSFTVISAYVVPQESGVKWLGDMVEKGMEVRILTNSLASTDVPAVHSGYARYRPELLHKGVILHETKALPGKRSRQNLFGSEPRSSLHAKTYIVDGTHVVIASFNLDPRSIKDNTELALTIHSRELAEQALEMYEETIRPDRSFAVTLADPDNKDSRALHWTTTEDGKKVTYINDPHASIWRRTKLLLYKFLPIEELL